MKKILFIGGPSDGYRKTWPTGSYSALTYTPGRADHCIPDPADPISFGITTHTYNLQQFRDTDGSVYEVAVHSSIKNTMEVLIKGYRYHRNPRTRR